MHYSVEAASADKLDSFPILLDRVLDFLCGERLLCDLLCFLHMYIRHHLALFVKTILNLFASHCRSASAGAGRLPTPRC